MAVLRVYADIGLRCAVARLWLQGLGTKLPGLGLHSCTSYSETLNHGLTSKGKHRLASSLEAHVPVAGLGCACKEGKDRTALEAKCLPTCKSSNKRTYRGLPSTSCVKVRKHERTLNLSMYPLLPPFVVQGLMWIWDLCFKVLMVV